MKETRGLQDDPKRVQAELRQAREPAHLAIAHAASQTARSLENGHNAQARNVHVAHAAAQTEKPQADTDLIAGLRSTDKEQTAALSEADAQLAQLRVRLETADGETRRGAELRGDLEAAVLAAEREASQGARALADAIAQRDRLLCDKERLTFRLLTAEAATSHASKAAADLPHSRLQSSSDDAQPRCELGSGLLGASGDAACSRPSQSNYNSKKAELAVSSKSSTTGAGSAPRSTDVDARTATARHTPACAVASTQTEWAMTQPVAHAASQTSMEMQASTSVHAATQTRTSMPFCGGEAGSTGALPDSTAHSHNDTTRASGEKKQSDGALHREVRDRSDATCL